VKQNYLPHLATRVFGVPLLIQPEKLSVILGAIRPRLGLDDTVVLEGLPAAATVGRPLPQPIRALVTDAHGNPASGVPVVFSARSGTVTPARPHTDSTGHAQARWVLGARAGEQVVEAVVKEGGLRAISRVRASAAPKRKTR
jgi:hypothetical protein